MMVFFFFSSRRRHTRCALVTGVQTCALPICARSASREHPDRPQVAGGGGAQAAAEVFRGARRHRPGDGRGPPPARLAAVLLSRRRGAVMGSNRSDTGIAALPPTLPVFPLSGVLLLPQGTRSAEHTSALQSLT